MIRRFLFGLVISGVSVSRAAPVESTQMHTRLDLNSRVSSSGPLSDQLIQIRKKIDGIERDWLQHLKAQKNAHGEMKKAQQLLQLQKKQKKLLEAKIQEIEKAMSALTSRKAQLETKSQAEQARVMRLMKALDASQRNLSQSSSDAALFSWVATEVDEAPRRKVMANLVDRGLKEIEVLRIDFADQEQLQAQIQSEKQQVMYLSQELEEQESVVALNQKLQMEILKKEKAQSLTQLENYRKLKSSEAQVENLIAEFSARAELEKSADTEKQVNREVQPTLSLKDSGQGVASQMAQNEPFSKLRGKLPLPLGGGKVVSGYGKGFDRLSGLQIFKKGIEIMGQKSQPVVAISSGRVAFSGELPNYGQVIIIDHGDHFYSLLGHLGSLQKKTKDWVGAGDLIGQTDIQGTPIYFEIRSRNVAVNPLQWVVN